MYWRFCKWLFILTVLAFCITSCKTSGPGIFGKKSPHEQYGDRLTNAGLRSTALGSSWFVVAEESIVSPPQVALPYKEVGYFSSERPNATALRFDAMRGQKLTIGVNKSPASNFTLYLDLWKAVPGKEPKHIASADTAKYSIEVDVDENSQYILRLQPELLSSGEYTITVASGPTLAYPIKAPGKNHTKSFWGAERDGGVRKHEGIDMFGERRTPIVAAAEGRITRVEETAVGGKVVWLKVRDKDYMLYYAHLDSQIVRDGDYVEIGDTLGLMGNTGNARTSSPHLHFGVYTISGPVDPWPFVKPVDKFPEKIAESSIPFLGKLARNKKTTPKMHATRGLNPDSSLTIQPATLLRIEAATAGWFRVELPDGQEGFMKTISVEEIDQPLLSLSTKNVVPLHERPDTLSAKKASITKNEPLVILANFGNYHFVKTPQNLTGWMVK